ncbi:DUF722 domain-containing protein [Lactococcus lactis]|uniref:DUF722 domain-containing protein n=1 Tax=Lactococcus lactis TaxID=1358 RepID=A0ABD5GQQ0_9LACT|nr:DUF722 domain-containing protein [Lactococcus lactis]MDV2619317.1 DUF722 domain-containing protein [Lactococcus lactis]
MADRLDLLLSDYMTGMLQVKINSRERWITREKHEERIGSGGSSSNTAPQERNYLIKEADKELGRLNDQKQTLDDLFNVFDGTVVQKIIIYKYKYRLTWKQVGIRMHTDDSALRKQYVKFKDTLRNNLWASTLEE